MIPLDVLAVFFTASVLLGLAPGPDNLFVLTQSALHGRSAGLYVVLGLCTGLMVHTAAVAVGVAVLFQTSAFAFTLLKVIGAGYLLYLAWQAFRARPSAWSDRGEPQIRPARLYGRGVVMNVTNPKVAILFLAFLPQFTDPERGPLGLQLIILGVTFIGATFLVFAAVSWGAGLLGEWLRRSERAQIILNRTAATVFVALALRLATTER